MKTAGLTGTPGCGKTTTLKIFEGLGWHTVDADAICAHLHANPDSGIHAPMRERWGDGILLPDGTTNKKAVGEIVFAHPEERFWLESLIQPAIAHEAVLKMESMPCEAKVLFDAAVMYEAGWDSLVECVICVWTDEKTQIKRLLERGWTEKHAKERIASQLSSFEKLERADFALINTGSIEYLQSQCTELDCIFKYC